MNANDLGRLELAKRAFLATQPRTSEVQAGVRRARLALRRPKRRRGWFGKGLVLVVLAVGGLAYAKPHAVGEALATVLARASAARGAARLGHELRASSKEARVASSTPASSSASSPTRAGALNQVAQTSSAAQPDPKLGADAGLRTTHPAARGASLPVRRGSKQVQETVSEWGRVGQALAQGDETRALALLGELSESDEPRTRDNADLGRARLLLSHGEPAQACAIARSLSRRAANQNVRHQAEHLLEACERELPGKSP